MIVDENMVKSPTISIIITFYNLGKYIKDCISSILNQTYQNFEIIVVNDGSDDENSEILNSINNEKVKIISLKENSGQLFAFLKGLETAQGEFVCMVDGDDILLPNYLKTLLGVHLKENVALVCASSGEINEKNEITSLNYVNNPLSQKQDKMNYRDIERLFNQSEEFDIKHVRAPFGLWSWNPSSSAMFRKTSLKILKYYPDVKFWKTGADKVIFSFLHLVGGSCNISAVCFLYRHHDKNNSKTTLSTGEKKYLSENYIKTLIKWNKKLRLDAFWMFISNKKELIEEYNKINYIIMLFKIIFCVNIKLCAKIIKTFAHNLIRI